MRPEARGAAGAETRLVFLGENPKRSRLELLGWRRGLDRVFRNG